MNEWSPGRNYSCPGTPNQRRRSFRSQRDDSEKRTKLQGVLTPGVSDHKSLAPTQHSMEEISKVILPGSSRNGGTNVTSDPRFKRVIPTGVQSSVNSEAEPKPQKSLLVHDDNETSPSRFPIWSNTEYKSNKSWVDCLKDSELSKFKKRESPVQSHQNIECFLALTNSSPAPVPIPTQTLEDSGFDDAQEPLKAVDKFAFNHDMAMKSVSKESLSEWAVNSRFGFEDKNEDFSNALERIPSSTRTKKVQNWIHEQRPKLERKHSVITVIGQMQEPDTLSSALQEIDRRRKLVKELDKFAVCKKLVGSDKAKGIADMMVKNKILSSGDGVLFSGSSETVNTSAQSIKFCDDNSNKNDNLSSDEKTVSHCNDASSMWIHLTGKGSPKKEEFKNDSSSTECPVKGKLQMVFSSFPYQKMFYVLFVICGILCWFAFFPIESGPYVTFDLFNSRPKPITWYERICNWLWEFFRPSDDNRVAFVLILVEVSQDDRRNLLNREKFLNFSKKLLVALRKSKQALNFENHQLFRIKRRASEVKKKRKNEKKASKAFPLTSPGA